MKKKPLTLFTLLFAMAPIYSSAEVKLVEYIDFDQGNIPFNLGAGSQNGGDIAILPDNTGQVPGSTHALRATYPVPSGGQYAWFGIDMLPYETKDVAVEFWAKMPSQTKHGLKFVKVFGERKNGNEYANATFGLDYTGVDYGSMYAVSFGDGSNKSNDTQNIIKFDGSNPDWVGRSAPFASISTPQNARWPSSSWGTNWHHFKLRVKFNSGTTKENEVADGLFYVQIDGKVYLNAKNIFNRHYENGNIESIQFAGWSQTGASPFEIWYDSIRVTINGFSDQPLMSPGVAKSVDK